MQQLFFLFDQRQGKNSSHIRNRLTNFSLAATWLITTTSTIGLLLAVQSYTRHSELEADKYSLDHGQFTEDEKFAIAQCWLTLMPQYVYRYPLQKYFTSHPLPITRAQSILNYINNQRQSSTTSDSNNKIMR